QTLTDGRNVPWHRPLREPAPAVPAAATRSGAVALAARRPSRLLNQFRYLPVTWEVAEPVQVRVHFDPSLGLVICMWPQAPQQVEGRVEVPQLGVHAGRVVLRQNVVRVDRQRSR